MDYVRLTLSFRLYISWKGREKDRSQKPGGAAAIIKINKIKLCGMRKNYGL